MVGYDKQKKTEELQDFVLKSTQGLIDSTWISSKIIRGNIEKSLIEFINEENINYRSSRIFRISLM